MEGHASELPIGLRDDLAYGLGSASRSRDDVLGSISAITPQLPGEAIHSLLGGSDGVDSGVSPSMMPKWLWMTLAGGQAVGGAGGIADNHEDCYTSRGSLPITNMGASAESAEMMTFLAPPFK